MNELQTTKGNDIATLLNDPRVKKQVQRAIPRHMDPDKLLRVALTAIRQNPTLMKCTQQSLLACVMGAAQLGLEPEPALGQVYLVPYFNKRKNQYEATLIPGYRGYISLARRSGEVQSVGAQVVYENDQFQLEYGLQEKLSHIPADGDRGGIKGAYVVFRYKDGGYSFDYMSRSDIDKIRERSKSGDSGPWVTDYAEMAKKTVIRRHIKLVPLSVELTKAAYAENMAMAGEDQSQVFMPELENRSTDDDVVKAATEAKLAEMKQRLADTPTPAAAAPQVKDAVTQPFTAQVVTDSHPLSRDKWIRLKGPGFRAYIEDNEDCIGDLSLNLFAEISRKWTALYDEVFPYNPGGGRREPEPQAEQAQSPEHKEDLAAREAAQIKADILNGYADQYHEALRRLGAEPDELPDELDALIAIQEMCAQIMAEGAHGEDNERF